MVRPHLGAVAWGNWGHDSTPAQRRALVTQLLADEHNRVLRGTQETAALHCPLSTWQFESGRAEANRMD